MSENPNNPDPFMYVADQRSHVGQKRPAGRIDKAEWWTDPRAVIRLALWMIDNGYERAEIERMAYKPRCYEVERIQCELEAGIELCEQSARERRGA